jgi:hypothetical protein
MTAYGCHNDLALLPMWSSHQCYTLCFAVIAVIQFNPVLYNVQYVIGLMLGQPRTVLILAEYHGYSRGFHSINRGPRNTYNITNTSVTTCNYGLHLLIKFR